MIQTNLAGPDCAPTAFPGETAVLLGAHRLKPSRHPHGVAIRAACGQNGAAGYGIPSGVSPFDRCFGHETPSSADRISRKWLDLVTRNYWLVVRGILHRWLRAVQARTVSVGNGHLQAAS